MPQVYSLQTSATIRIRAVASIEGQLLAEPPPNAPIAVWVGEEGSPVTTDDGVWYRVEYNGIKGWQKLLHSTFEQQYKSPPAPEPLVTLFRMDDVPYYSQVDTDTPEALDCGEVSMRMVLAHRLRRLKLLGEPPSTADIRKTWGKVAGTLTSLTTIKLFCAQLGVQAAYLNPPATTPEGLRTELDKGYPLIALIQDYGKITNRQDTWTGGHIAVATGYSNQGVYIHDPLAWGSRKAEGIHKHIPWSEWVAARTAYLVGVTGYLPLPGDVPVDVMVEREYTHVLVLRGTERQMEAARTALGQRVVQWMRIEEIGR